MILLFRSGKMLIYWPLLRLRLNMINAILTRATTLLKIGVPKSYERLIDGRKMHEIISAVQTFTLKLNPHQIISQLN